VGIDLCTIRRAQPQDAAALAQLAFASKSHWNYDADFMARVRPALTPSADYIANDPVFLAEAADGTVAGFYGFSARNGDVFLEDLWVHPSLIGTGLGRVLWEHACATARAAGYSTFLIESDPNAVPFYVHCGARPIGEIVSSATQRVLPLLRFDLAEWS
jgi:GNAT superfamily N-acetyltransferase